MPLLLVAVAAIASFYLVSRDESPDGTSESGLREGYYLTGVTLRSTDRSGEVEYELRAARAEHNPADSSITLSQLALDYGRSEDPWLVRAERGYMPDAETSIALSGGVKITRPTASAEQVRAISSETLLIELDTQRASTTDDVAIGVGAHQLDGTGMNVDFQNEQLEILSNVHGRFEARVTP